MNLDTKVRYMHYKRNCPLNFEAKNFVIHCLGQDCDQGSYIIDAIESSRHFQEVTISINDPSEPTFVPSQFQFARACATAAKKNPSVSKINLISNLTAELAPHFLGVHSLVGYKLGILSIQLESEDDNWRVGDDPGWKSLMVALATSEYLRVDLSMDGIFLDLMEALSQVEKPSLKELLIEHNACIFPSLEMEDRPTLPGIDDFLASNAAKLMETLELHIWGIQPQGLLRLNQGLSSTPASLSTLHLHVSQAGELDPTLQDGLVSTLCGRTDIKKLTLQNIPIHESAQQSMADFLAHNQHLHTLKWEVDKQGIGAVATAENLFEKSTWKSLKLKITGIARPIGPHVGRRLESQAYKGLEFFEIENGSLRPEDTKLILRAMDCSWQNLKELRLLTYTIVEETDALAILKAAETSCSLEKLHFHICCTLTLQSWKTVAGLISELKLLRLIIRAQTFPGVKDVQDMLLNGLVQNTSLEQLLIRFVQHRLAGPTENALQAAAFQAEQHKLCLRNMAMKVSNRLTKNVAAGGLPLAALTPCLKAIAHHSKTQEEKKQLYNTVLFSLLKDQDCLPKESWGGMKAHFAGDNLQGQGHS